MNLNLTLIGQSVGFALFVFFCMKYVWPPITAALRERQTKITAGLEASKRAERDLELAQEKVGEQLKQAKEQAAEIIDQANKRGGQIVEEAKVQAREEGERLKAAALAEIEQETNRAKEALRAEVAELVVSGAEQVLGSSVDAGKHGEFLDKLAAGL